MLRKANMKRSLDDLVIQKGEFDWRTLLNDEAALGVALGEFEDVEDSRAAVMAAREEVDLVGADAADFADVDGGGTASHTPTAPGPDQQSSGGVGENVDEEERGREGRVLRPKFARGLRLLHQQWRLCVPSLTAKL